MPWVSETERRTMTPMGETNTSSTVSRGEWSEFLQREAKKRIEPLKR